MKREKKGVVLLIPECLIISPGWSSHLIWRSWGN